jgi:small neutral amino acid transporter SnatA (MarC family)
VIHQSTATALALALGFVLFGKVVFRLLGITMADFMMAGGAILFCLATIDILHGEKERRLHCHNADPSWNPNGYCIGQLTQYVFALPVLINGVSSPAVVHSFFLSVQSSFHYDSVPLFQ